MNNRSERNLRLSRVSCIAVVLVAGLVLLDTGRATADKSKSDISSGLVVEQPRFTRAGDTSYSFDGIFGEYLKAISDNWLKVVPEQNPSIIDVFANRQRDLGWLLPSHYGEYRGKYLTGAVEVLRLRADEQLKNVLQDFVDKVLRYQGEDGYLGIWPKEDQLTGKSPKSNCAKTWDAWSHYHLMLGLVFWSEETGDKKAFDAALRAADLLCDTFLGKPGSMAAMGELETNLSPIHILGILYRKTGRQRYLDLARQIVEEEFTGTEQITGKQNDHQGDGDPAGNPPAGAGDYFRAAMAGKELYETPGRGPRWESLHTIMGLAELYWITSNDDYRRAFEHFWWSVARLDRHNTGGFSSDERAVGNPYFGGPIETCCTVAWTAMSAEMLKLTGNSVVADELELTLLNAIMGYEVRSGRMCTYNTPMNGRCFSFFPRMSSHGKPGSPHLSCCTTNSARGFGLVNSWALMTDADGLVLNWYGPCEMTTKLNGISIGLKQRTDYPRTGSILLQVLPSRSTTFDLKLRIPYWSQKTQVTVNDTLIKNLVPGRYLVLSRKWKQGDQVRVELDMSLHYWAGERQCQGATSIYRGPILLALNYDPEKGQDLPSFDAANMKSRLVETERAPNAIVALEFSDIDGNKVLLNDFDSATEDQKHYVTWLKVLNAPKMPFSKSNPLRSGRVFFDRSY